MPWITLTTDDLLRSVSDPERDALSEAATAAGQAEPLAGILSDVTAEVRGYVAACSANELGAEGTIPGELKNTALAIARYEAFTRLPVGRSLLTEDRVSARDSAITRLRDVAACRFRIEQPTVPADVDVGAPSPSVGERTRTFTRDDQEGI